MKSRTIFATAAFFVIVAFTAQTGHAQKVEEQNLGKQKNIPVYLPDLAVTGMEVLNSDTGKLKVSVTNKGKGPAQWAELRLIVWDLNGKIYALIGQGQPALSPKETQIVIFEVEKPVASMKYELITDYTKRIGESNELNNIFKGYIGKY